MAITNAQTRLSQDPLRNFKFQVQMTMNPTTPDGTKLQQELGTMGFVEVSGLNMSTEMIPYREGGWNTNLHKMPGMTDFSPVTLSSGVFYGKPGMWNLAKQIFSVQWGDGNLTGVEDYRFDMTVRVFDHPVTKSSSTTGTWSPEDAVLAFKIYNAWVANVSFSGLDSVSNSILVSQMTVHHEGLDVFFGDQAIAASPSAAG
jgi:phage tail-like protein